MKFIPYSTFEGNAEEAIQFYADALDGEILGMTRYKDAPADALGFPIPDDYLEKVMHCALNIQGETLYFSDAFPGMPVTKGNGIAIMIACVTEEELRNTFDKLAQDGEVAMPVDKTFWGSIFGSLVDKFGIGWNLEYELPQE